MYAKRLITFFPNLDVFLSSFQHILSLSKALKCTKEERDTKSIHALPYYKCSDGRVISNIIFQSLIEMSDCLLRGSGRPQFDEFGVAVVMTLQRTSHIYRNVLDGQKVTIRMVPNMREMG